VVRIAPLQLDPSARRVTGRQDGRTHPLNAGPTEFRLLHVLVQSPERVHTRGQLRRGTRGDDVFIEERTVDVHVKRLREALAPARCASLIKTVRGVGYRLITMPTEPSRP
jgi:two-component system phosphate regulon response regulator PhoB